MPPVATDGFAKVVLDESEETSAYFVLEDDYVSLSLDQMSDFTSQRCVADSEIILKF